MVGGIIQVEMLGTFCNQADQAAVQWESYLANSLRAQAICRHEDMFAFFAVGQVDRTDVCANLDLQLFDDDIQGINEIIRVVDFLNDPVERLQHARLAQLLPVKTDATGFRLDLLKLPLNAVRIENRCEFVQGLGIDIALEVDDLVDRIPVLDPFPVVKLGLFRVVQAEIRLVAENTKQEPALFLADADRIAILAHVTPRQAILEPVTSLAEHINLVWLEPDLFAEFTKHCLFGRLVFVDASLRKLPGILADALGPEKFALIVTEYYSDIWPETIGINHKATTIMNT